MSAAERAYVAEGRFMENRRPEVLELRGLQNGCDRQREAHGLSLMPRAAYLSP